MADAPLIVGRLRRDLLKHTLEHAPNEVGGLIIDGAHVVVIPNRAEDRTDRFEFLRSDMIKAAESFGLMVGPGLFERLALWHSHPAGGVGPSRVDMQQRLPLEHHLVVALVDGDIVPTWY